MARVARFLINKNVKRLIMYKFYTARDCGLNSKRDEFELNARKNLY